MKLDRFINRPVLSTVISILIVILGLLGLVALPIEQYPSIAPATIRVSTSYQGANAQTVLNSVIAPLEEQINGVENMDYMTSTATNTGEAEITVYFKQGVNPDMAAVNVQNRVAKAQGLLPAEVTKVGVIAEKRQTSMLLVFSLYSSDNRYDAQFLENYASINVVPEIKRIPGVGDAMVMGSDYSMRIWLKPDVMAEYKLMPSDVSLALAEQNIEAAPGQFGELGDQSFQYVMKYKGRLQEVPEFEDIVIRASADGEVLRLKDIATIELGRLSYGFSNDVNGHPGVTMIVFQTAGSNATAIIQNIEKYLDEIKNTLPPGVKEEVLMSANDFLFASIEEVVKTLLEAFLLVVIVVYVFLQDFRSTLIPIIAIPVALIGTFFMLYLIGFSLNLLTLCAMVLAIAIVVDDAIVVVEGVHAKLDQGYQSAKKASIDAMSELGGAIVSITLVMMAVFIPVSFMTGTSGTFYRQFGLTMAIAIGLSAINALTLSPALCALFLKPHNSNHEKKSTFVSRFHDGFNVAYDAVLKKYKKGVLFFVHKRWISFGLVGIGCALLVFLMKITPTGMVPNEDTGTVFVVLNTPPGTSQERTQAALMKVDSLVAANPAVRSRTMITGYSMIAGQGNTYGTEIVKLKDWGDRDGQPGQDLNTVIGTLYMQAKMGVPDANVLLFAPPMIPGYSVSNGFEFNLQDKTGGDLDKFFGVAQGFLAKLNQRPEVSAAYTAFNPTFPQYMIDIDAAKCKKAGISPSDILTALQGYYGGLYASNFNRFGRLYRVMIQADPKYRISPETLNQVKVRNGSEMAPITQFLTLKKVYGPDNIKRFNMFTAMPVNGSAAPGYSSGEAIQAIKEVAAETLPQGYGFEFSGMTREEANTTNSVALIFVLCMVFVYLLLSAQYESYILPLAVLLSIPFGLAGSFIFAQFMHVENNIYLQIALIMLIGLLAKNAILIVEFALDRRKQGMSILWSAIAGSAARLRPILMTSLALVIGLLPLMFASGVGANGNSTIGTGAIGGMLIGMITQIFIVPVLFVAFQSLQERFKPMEVEPQPDDIEAEIEKLA